MAVGMSLLDRALAHDQRQARSTDRHGVARTPRIAAAGLHRPPRVARRLRGLAGRRAAGPGGYGERDPVELREALSWVFLTKDRAYKLKKPLRLPYVDYSTAALRRDMCHEELRLNRRLAPDIYVDVRAVMRDGFRARLGHSGDPGAIDHVVEMRRYDEGAMAAAALLRGRTSRCRTSGSGSPRSTPTRRHSVPPARWPRVARRWAPRCRSCAPSCPAERWCCHARNG